MADEELEEEAVAEEDAGGGDSGGGDSGEKKSKFAVGESTIKILKTSLTYIINAIIAFLIYSQLSWAKWLAVFFPTLGVSALLISTILKGKGAFIDYIILLLDVLIIFLTIKHFFI